MNCEYCGRLHNGKYGSGRFCSQQCARGFSTKAKRKEINKRVSYTLTNRQQNDPLLKEITRKAREKAKETVRKKKLARRVKIGGIELDITYGELEEYRKAHPVCEICGNPERRRSYKGKELPNKLAIDHDHKTGKFRGLLCSKCNYNLGWFEGERDNIIKFIGE